MAYTDIVILVLVVLYALSGWKKGLMRILLGPLSLAVCVILSFWYYQRTQNVWLSLAIGVLGPFFLNGLLSIVLALLRKAIHGDDDTGPSVFSRLAGSLVNVTWSGGLILISLYLFTRIPADTFNVGALRKDVERSWSYAVMVAAVDSAFPHWSGKSTSTQQVKQDLQETEEYQRLMADDRVRALFEDEEIMKQVQAKNLTALMNNPKLLEVMDPQLIQDFFKLNEKYLQQQTLPQITVPPPADSESP